MIPIPPPRLEEFWGRCCNENYSWLSEAVIEASRVENQVYVITRKSRLLEVRKSITRLTLFLIDLALMSAADMWESWISHVEGLGWEWVEVVSLEAVKASKEVVHSVKVWSVGISWLEDQSMSLGLECFNLRSS